MELKANSSEKKLSGSYYTPKKIADTMTALSIKDLPTSFSALEPSCGDGIFVDALYQAAPNCELTAVEIDPMEAKKVSDKHAEHDSVHVCTEDFFTFYKKCAASNRYDLILGNPPYIRYQYLSQGQRDMQAEILTSNKMKSNKLINVWVAFFVACIQMLKDNGTISFVIPAEILQVAYAEDLRQFLSTHLESMTMITFKELVFPNIEQEILIFIGKKRSALKGIRIIEAQDINEFQKMDLTRIRFQPLTNSVGKWTQYFVDVDEMELLDRIRNSPLFTPFSSCGLINVGITTGNNKYFSIDKATEKAYGLESATLPLIGRSSHAHGIFFTKEDWETNIKAKKRAMLIKFPEDPYENYPQGYKDYIYFGEKNDENSGYKCSIRDRWYIVPSVWIPDAFFLRRNNLYPKFVLNKCNAVSTDTMHRMKFNDGVDGEDILISYYNSISFAFAEVCGRSYGGGVLEILPREMGNIMLPKVANINSTLKAQIISYVDDVVRNDKDIEIALNYVDQHLLIDVLGIPAEWCSSCRKIWKKLQNRRLTRGK